MKAEENKQKIAFFGLMLVNFIVMFLIAGVGMYSYTVALQYNNIASVGMVFVLECVARSVTIPIGGTLGNKIGHKKLFLGALALYIVAYAGVTFANGFWMFTIARMISGFAWGLFMMNVFVLLTAIFGEDAPKYSGYNQSLTTVATYMALFFASDEAAFVTSQIVTVDGGTMSHAPINTALRKLAENTK